MREPQLFRKQLQRDVIEMGRRVVQMCERNTQRCDMTLTRHEAAFFAIVETHCVGNRVGQQCNAVPGLRGQPNARRVGACVLLLKINFVADDDAWQCRRQLVDQLLRHGCVRFNNHQREIGITNRCTCALDAHRFDGISRVAQSRRVNDFSRQTFDTDSALHGVTRSAGNRRHDGYLVACERVEQARFAHVGFTRKHNANAVMQ